MQYQITYDGFLARGFYILGVIEDMKIQNNGMIRIWIKNNRFKCPEVSIMMDDIAVA